ncbi:MAG: hypothetical protein V4595_06615 [Pseudomonadota bacterium]|jgi:hypothetical protein
MGLWQQRRVTLRRRYGWIGDGIRHVGTFAAVADFNDVLRDPKRRDHPAVLTIVATIPSGDGGNTAIIDALSPNRQDTDP